MLMFISQCEAKKLLLARNLLCLFFPHIRTVSLACRLLSLPTVNYFVYLNIPFGIGWYYPEVSYVVKALYKPEKNVNYL
jgi:hypothetical protein